MCVVCHVLATFRSTDYSMRNLLFYTGFRITGKALCLSLRGNLKKKYTETEVGEMACRLVDLSSNRQNPSEKLNTEPGIGAHTLRPSIQEDFCKFEASMLYIASSGLPRAI